MAEIDKLGEIDGMLRAWPRKLLDWYLCNSCLLMNSKETKSWIVSSRFFAPTKTKISKKAMPDPDAAMCN